ncbi:hypothetical protein BS78_10G064700 [Paspalum vaginatum]|nr:hypothetical protein BS78_10G064700 [Paspalum vaginatum]
MHACLPHAGFGYGGVSSQLGVAGWRLALALALPAGPAAAGVRARPALEIRGIFYRKKDRVKGVLLSLEYVVIRPIMHGGMGWHVVLALLCCRRNKNATRMHPPTDAQLSTPTARAVGHPTPPIALPDATRSPAVRVMPVALTLTVSCCLAVTHRDVGSGRPPRLRTSRVNL